MIFDPKLSRIIIFGGWANKWLADCHTLRVNMITGPPYTIYSIHPNTGP